MIEILFTVIILALVACFALYIHETNKEKAKLVNALIAKDAHEMTNLTLADNTKIEPEINPPSDLIPTEQLTPEQFDEMIDAQNAEELGDVNG